MRRGVLSLRWLPQGPVSSAQLRSYCRCSTLRGSSRSHRAQSRNKSSSTKASLANAPAPRRPVLPERLLIFHAGTGRSVFLGCWKVSSIMMFGFFSLVLAPAHLKDEEQPAWVATGVFVTGLIPMAFAVYLTSPFVANIHLRLPPFARYSRELAQRYSQALPKDAKLDITTLNFIGMPRITRINVSELRPTRERFGLVDYVRDMKHAPKRPWYMGQATRKFAIHHGKPLVQGSGIWENIVTLITKRSM